MTYILSYLKPYRLQILLAYLFTFTEIAAELLFPLFLGIMINQGIIPEDTSLLYFWGSIMLGTTLLAFLSGIMNSYFAAHISTAAGHDIREHLFAKIQEFSFDMLTLYPVSMIITRFTNDIRIVQNTILMGLRIMVKAPIMVIGSVFMSFIIDWKLSLVFLITVPILIFFLGWVLKVGSRLFTQVQERVDHVNRVIQESIGGMRIIKAFVRRDFEAERFDQSNKRLATKTQTAFRFVEASMPVLLLVMNASLLFIIWVGNQQAIAGTTSVGDVVAIVNYALRTVMMMSMFTFISLAFSRAKASGERISMIMHEKTAPVKQKSSHAQPIQKGTIRFEAVDFSFPNSSLMILKNIDFQLHQEETLAIMGATGAGKTTLFQLIPRLYSPNSGQIYIDNTPIEQFDLKALRDGIGYVSQNPLLFTGSIVDNIRFGKEDASMDEVIAASKAAQIHESILSFPQQYHSIVGQKGVNLSGGQKQRISIARALIRHPKILMFDDSTSALDVQTEAKLLDALKEYNNSALIITQKISTAQRADRILLLDKGEVAGIGTHKELMHASSLYRQIVSSQSAKEVDHA
ncbi:MAG TPA: ABC transporter ATP-binding protein [Pseudogracilibacillus sp.]|nr:ABC transporter ATP-binding protein [Pseudogracilibacillus sp.]